MLHFAIVVAVDSEIGLVNEFIRQGNGEFNRLADLGDVLDLDAVFIMGNAYR